MRKLFADLWLLLEIVFNLLGAMIIWWLAFGVADAMLPALEDKPLLLLDFYGSIAWWGFAFVSMLVLTLFQNSIHRNWQNRQYIRSIVFRWSIGFFALSYVAFLFMIIQAWTTFVIPFFVTIAHLLLALLFILIRITISPHSIKK